MNSVVVKSEAHELIDQLPKEATWNDLAYQTSLRADIEAGLADSEAGNVFTVDSLLQEFGLKQ